MARRLRCRRLPHNAGTLMISGLRKTVGSVAIKNSRIRMSYLQHFQLRLSRHLALLQTRILSTGANSMRAPKPTWNPPSGFRTAFVVITGEIGSGKTTLLQSFLGELDDHMSYYAVVSQTQLTPTQFLQSVLTEFGFKPFRQEERSSFWTC